ncbi:MAG: PEP-CTERM sorting domain-containing protein [Nanoarchaeota archaeon]
MSFKKTLTNIIFTGALALGGLSEQAKATLYDDFSSPTLNTSKWDVRQDYEGWAFSDEYGIENGVFHTQTNNARDTGTFLVPKHQFVAGDTFEYDLNYNGGTGNRVSMLFVNKQNRYGLVGNWNGSGNQSFGTYHIKLEFLENGIKSNFQDLDFSFPGGILPTTSNAPYEIYIGMRTGGNGTAHFDYDNFYINGVPEPATLSLLALGSLALLKKRKNKI